MRNKKGAYTKDTEIGALLEDFNGKLGLVAEQTAQIPSIKEDIQIIKEDMHVMKTDIEFIKSDLKKKVDYDEFSALERRVIALENQR